MGEQLHLILIISVSFIFFIVIRELVMWYWKINKGINLLENILMELKQLNKTETTVTEEVSITKLGTDVGGIPTI
ncbi:MAG TPA: hypothetical protein VI911_08415 [Patescibacteria group bacterium]|nr:MAG: hypothetical protein A2417_14510 [Bdellovibrionales bacterium RIFOXYC1_FULL_37_79]OFZ57584.1 MAG: hypothetical protein A2381_18835 [Bdellovibrionales bacterium RIFOXYB1_FULL_37_110]HLD91019.1 hypothetical protein [Patescibacteria group bacterium]